MVCLGSSKGCCRDDAYKMLWHHDFYSFGILASYDRIFREVDPTCFLNYLLSYLIVELSFYRVLGFTPLGIIMLNWRDPWSGRASRTLVRVSAVWDLWMFQTKFL